MKCSACSKEAITEVGWKDKAYCEDHFKRYFLGQVRKVLDKFNVNGKICLALSGGKDSTACLEALSHFDLELRALHLDLGISGYSEPCKEVAEKTSKELGIELEIIDLWTEYGTSIPAVVEKEEKKPCGMCGTIKRYLTNKHAYEQGFDFVATGHNLSDQVASVFNNLVNVYLTPLRGVGPVLEPRKKYKLAGKVKPLYYLTDEECRIYSNLLELPIYKEKCPYSRDAPTNEMKEWLHDLDSEIPGVLRNFAKSFMRISERMGGRGEEISQCRVCGYATATDICRFCRLVGKSKDLVPTFKRF